MLGCDAGPRVTKLAPRRDSKVVSTHLASAWLGVLIAARRCVEFPPAASRCSPLEPGTLTLNDRPTIEIHDCAAMPSIHGLKAHLHPQQHARWSSVPQKSWIRSESVSEFQRDQSHSPQRDFRRGILGSPWWSSKLSFENIVASRNPRFVGVSALPARGRWGKETSISTWVRRTSSLTEPSGAGRARKLISTHGFADLELSARKGGPSSSQPRAGPFLPLRTWERVAVDGSRGVGGVCRRGEFRSA